MVRMRLKQGRLRCQNDPSQDDNCTPTDIEYCLCTVALWMLSTALLLNHRPLISSKNAHRARKVMKSPSARDISEFGEANAGHHHPLVDAVLQAGTRSDEAPFHIPGHKRGSSVHPAFRKLMSAGLAHDLTEILGDCPPPSSMLLSPCPG
jgi:hypothetical protein